MIKKGCLLLFVLLLGGLWPAMAETQVHVNINIGPPAPVVVEAPPHMLFLNDPGVYVAVGIPYDVFFFSGHYYYLHGNNWFWGPGYRGPWTYVEYRSLPPGLRKYQVARLREYREREYKSYKVQGEKFNGKHFMQQLPRKTAMTTITVMVMVMGAAEAIIEIEPTADYAD